MITFTKNNTIYVLTKGELEYWYKKRFKTKSKKVLLKEGYLIETPPFEMHALKITKIMNLLYLLQVCEEAKIMKQIHLDLNLL